jgi:hypothetical protein
MNKQQTFQEPHLDRETKCQNTCKTGKMSRHRQKKIKRNRVFNITGIILHCQFGCTVGPVMPSWKKRKVRLENGGGKRGKKN